MNFSVRGMDCRPHQPYPGTTMRTHRKAKSGRKHQPDCPCWRCYAATLGIWLDDLGTQTVRGRWDVFATISYRTDSYPWGRGFPLSGSGRPSPDFGYRLFDTFVRHLEEQLGSRVEFVVADHYGTEGGRFHQHALLAANGLAAYSMREMDTWLKAHAGWSRVLPFRQGAAHYIAKYIGRNPDNADWRVGIGSARTRTSPAVGKTVIAQSASVPKAFFHQTLPHRKK
jgi:hypothetical protein